MAMIVAASGVSALSVFVVQGNAADAATSSGVGVVLNAPVVSIAPVPTADGYWEVASDGGVFTFGTARFYGSAGATTLNRPIVALQPTPDGGGYWEVASDGGVFTFGNARFYGSAGAMKLNRPIVGMQPTPDGQGYWLVASDGGVFTFGDAQFYGSIDDVSPFSGVVGITATADGKGYWLVEYDGAVHAFGDADGKGSSVGGQPVIGISGGGPGYRLDTADGSIYTFGDQFYGSLSGQRLNQPIVAMDATPDGRGYWLVAADGGVFTFGDARFYGSLGGSTVFTANIVDNGVTPAQVAAWDKVNICEEGGRWNVDGPVYSGGLGFSHQNWTRFNTFGYPTDAADATPLEQIRVAVAFATFYLGGPNAAPDQHGCAGGY
jgi:Transglycosylase-like domain